MAGADAAAAPELPVAFVAVAVKVYAVPFVRPVTSQDPDAPVTVQVLAGSPTTVTVKDAGVPPVAPAATVTVTLPSPAATAGVAGMPGKPRTVTATEPADQAPSLFAALSPTSLVIAATRNEYVPLA
jgi:hypothetical protein